MASCMRDHITRYFPQVQAVFRDAIRDAQEPSDPPREEVARLLRSFAVCHGGLRGADARAGVLCRIARR